MHLYHYKKIQQDTAYRTSSLRVATLLSPTKIVVDYSQVW